MRFDFYGSEPQYLQHLAPLYRALRPEERGAFLVPARLAEYAGRLALAPTLGRPEMHPGADLLVVAAIQDLRPDRRHVFLEHGAGQSYCLAPGTRILTDDLRWIPIESARIGDQLYGFEEEPSEIRGRRARIATVLAVRLLQQPCYRLHMADGSKIVSSADHRWLRRSRNQSLTWGRTKDLQSAEAYGERATKLVKVFDPWDEDRSWGAGYLAAAFDGEGSFTQTYRDRSRGLRNMLNFTQKPNAMLDEVVRELRTRGFDFHLSAPNADTGVVHLTIRGGRSETLRFLGAIRPRRLLSNFIAEDTAMISGRNLVAVEEIEYIGEQTVVALETDCKTFVAEGFASHNSGTTHPSYAGGAGRERVELFLCPNEGVAERNRARYPKAQAVAIGCPKLDHLIDRGPGDKAAAISFHFNCSVAPESRNAFRHYSGALRELHDAVPTFGHGHPRIFGWLAPQYEAAGIPSIPEFSDVLASSDVFIVDNSSTLFEYAAHDRPVVVMNAPWYRRNVNHGLRFWSEADIGEQVNEPGELVPAVLRALEGQSDAQVARRREIVGQVYGPIDGQASQRGAEAMRELVRVAV